MNLKQRTCLNPSRYPYRVCFAVLSLFVCFIASADPAPPQNGNIGFNANSTESIDHFRAFTPSLLLEENNLSFVAKITEDSHGYLWVSGRRSRFYRYDGFELKTYTSNAVSTTGENQVLSILSDDQGQLWMTNSEVHMYDRTLDEFISYAAADGMFIHELVDDKKGGLWLGGNGFGFAKFDKQTKQFVSPYSVEKFEQGPEFVHSMAIDTDQQILWIVSAQGIYTFDVLNDKLKKIDTPLDKLWSTFVARDISLDIEKNALWVASPNGLLRVNTVDHSSRVYGASSEKNSLPSDFINTTFLDSAGNLWVGIEKQGLCVYRSNFDDFLCLPASEKSEMAIPAASIESINEDSKGSLWIALNSKGFTRITPALEKFESIESRITTPSVDYFQKSFKGVMVNDSDLWIATDGGGIQVFNVHTGEFSNIKHDRNNPNSLPSDSVITITKDLQGNVWVGMWGGGISKINPQTMQFTNYKQNPDAKDGNSLAGNNIFRLAFDMQGRLWISVWHEGLQMYDTNTSIFTRYSKRPAGLPSLLSNEISDFEIIGDTLWLVSGEGLETVNINTGEIALVSALEHCFCNSVYTLSSDTLAIGASYGFYLYNLITQTFTHYPLGTEENQIETYHFYENSPSELWIGTSNGVKVFNLQQNTFRAFKQEDGLVGNSASQFGDIFRINNELYLPNHNGVSIINPNDLPQILDTIPSMISAVRVLKSEGDDVEAVKFDSGQIKKVGRVELAHSSNNLQFSFTSIDTMFPNRASFKYRLRGLQEDFEFTSANNREARYNNLQAGDYVFEVYAANSADKWDEQGAQFSFTILAPWWSTPWARLSFLLLLLLSIYLIVKWRLYLVNQHQAELAILVDEKTKLLKEQQLELKHASTMLEKLNADLEQRVRERTAELQIEVNERKVAEKKLFHQAFHDSLTGLPNREWIVKKLDSLINQKRHFGLMFLDGDRFKTINDTHGHAVGDEILIASAIRLTSQLNQNMYAARLGGDEFTVVAEDVTDVGQIKELAEAIIEVFEKPFELENLTLHFNVTVGVVMCDEKYTTVTGALRDADIAMYQAKEAGKGIYRVFDQEMRVTALELSELEADLRLAIEQESLHLAYQPIADLSNDTICGFEALVRWEHPTRGNVPPDMFIPIAEETGLIIALGEWVLNKACSQLKQWQLFDCVEDLTMSVNLSSNQLKGKDFIRILDKALSNSGIAGKYLKLELTETSLIENTDILKDLLAEICKRGVELAIDDFGTGYSSLSYLTILPVQHIKIDRKFVDAIDNTPDSRINKDAVEIVKAAITLGQSVRMKVTAEGIETQTEMDVIKALGCEYAQGYLISKPLLAEQVLAFVKPPLHYEEEVLDNRPLLKFQEQQKSKNRRLKKRKPDDTLDS